MLHIEHGYPAGGRNAYTRCGLTVYAHEATQIVSKATCPDCTARNSRGERIEA